MQFGYGLTNDLGIAEYSLRNSVETSKYTNSDPRISEMVEPRGKDFRASDFIYVKIVSLWLHVFNNKFGCDG